VDADPDRVLIAQLHGEAKHHAKWRELTEAEHAAAVTELRGLANGRADLLAHVAGILEGASEGQLDELRARQAAALCRAAGADPDLISQWAEEGRRGGAGRLTPDIRRSRDGGRPGVPEPKAATGNLLSIF
jgi:hypothetical protein